MDKNAIPGLNQAILVVNKINLPKPVEVLYQTNECYGCPLIKLTPLEILETADNSTTRTTISESQRFLLSTKFSFQLELRESAFAQDETIAQGNARDNAAGTISNWCRLQDVSLNSQGQYQVDVSPAGGANLSNNQSLLCSLKTIDSGECLLCPFAILICLLFAIAGLEQLYNKFWLPKRRRTTAGYDRAVPGGGAGKLSAPDVEPAASGQLESQVSQGQGDGHSAGSSDGDHGHLQAPRAGEQRSVLASSPQSRRIESLDVFRGLTLAGMIFVNYGGAGYAAWEHTPWDGITPADFVFPYFIFSMGASVAISVRSLVKRHPKSFKDLALKIARRSATLALLGICLNSKWINYNQSDGLSKLRLTGVLQRFSISYLVVAFIYAIKLTLNKWLRAQSLSQVPYLSKLIGVIFELLIAVNYLAIHIYLTFFFEFDSKCPLGYIGPGGQTDGGRYATCTGGTAAWLDRTILGTNHIYNDHEVKQTFMTKVSHDPEGILGYTTSILLTLIGLQCGKILIGNGTQKQKLLALGQWSVVLMLASSLVLFIPINKRLWSLTFVIVTALAANLTVTLLYVVIDVYSCSRTFLLRLVSSAGKNSIFLYVGHSLITGMLPWWFPIGDQSSHLQLLLRLSWATFVWLLVAHYMALKGLFIKV